jgi:periplasmic protein TonB
MRIMVGGSVQAARLVDRVQPVYPEDAKNDHIEGTIALRVVIGTDGTVREVPLISGHPALAQSAIDAVQHRRYRPTLLNGNPVEILARIARMKPQRRRRRR